MGKSFPSRVSSAFSEPISEALRSEHNPLGRTILTLELILQLVGAAGRQLYSIAMLIISYCFTQENRRCEYLTDTGKRAKHSVDVDTFHLKLSPLNEV